MGCTVSLAAFGVPAQYYSRVRYIVFESCWFKKSRDYFSRKPNETKVKNQTRAIGHRNLPGILRRKNILNYTYIVLCRMRLRCNQNFPEIENMSKRQCPSRIAHL